MASDSNLGRTGEPVTWAWGVTLSRWGGGEGTASLFVAGGGYVWETEVAEMGIMMMEKNRIDKLFVFAGGWWW